MNVETNPPARLPHHDSLPAHAAVLRSRSLAAGRVAVSVNLHGLGPGARVLVQRVRVLPQERGWSCAPVEAARTDRALWRLRGRAPVLR